MLCLMRALMAIEWAPSSSLTVGLNTADGAYLPIALSVEGDASGIRLVTLRISGR